MRHDDMAGFAGVLEFGVVAFAPDARPALTFQSFDHRRTVHECVILHTLLRLAIARVGGFVTDFAAIDPSSSQVNQGDIGPEVPHFLGDRLQGLCLAQTGALEFVEAFLGVAVVGSVLNLDIVLLITEFHESIVTIDVIQSQHVGRKILWF